MKLLKLMVNGHQLFQQNLEINFVAQQKVTEENKKGLYPLFSKIYKQDVVGIIGINASGKTSTLKILSFILDIYLKNGQINEKKYSSLLGTRDITVEAYFSDISNKFYKIVSIITKNDQNVSVFSEELLWVKKISSSTNKKNLFEFNENHLKIIRSKENSPYLSNSMSIMISQVKAQQNQPEVIDLLDDTNLNVMRVDGEIPSEIVRFLDKSVEYIKSEVNTTGKEIIKLKFFNQEEEISLSNRMSLEGYLSSGTIKGLNVFAGIQNVLMTGGFLIVDEIENHFNKEIVRTIIQFFKNKHINMWGATLIFTTHYSELLDDFERNDSIYIAFKDNTLRLENLSHLLKRNDYKKSEVYQSSYLGNTAPSYDNYMALKKYFIQNSKERLQQHLSGYNG